MSPLMSCVPQEPGASARVFQFPAPFIERLRFYVGNNLVLDSSASSGETLEQRNTQHLDTQGREVESLLKTALTGRMLMSTNLGWALPGLLVIPGGHVGEMRWLGRCVAGISHATTADCFLWATVISGYPMAGQSYEALIVYDRMRDTV